MAQLNEAGARNSASDAKHIQAIHDSAASIGAACGAKESALSEATVLRQAVSQNAMADCIRSAVMVKYRPNCLAGSCCCQPCCPYPYVRDIFPDTAIVSVKDDLFAIPYTCNEDTGEMVCTLGDAVEVEIAYVPAADEGAPDDNMEALRSMLRDTDGVLLSEREIPVKAREKIAAEDFAGKDKSFPIVKPEDVSAAAQSIGRAGAGNYPAAELKANIIRIATRKGAAFMAKLPAAWKTKKESADVALMGDLIPLVERAVAADGTVPLKIIKPGWGSSGHYSAEVLKRDGPKIFTAGTKMFADHPTAEEEAARPERSIKDQMAVLSEDAHYEENGSAGPGLYAQARVLEPWRAFVDSAAKDIGVSIRARGKASQGIAEGRTGPIIERLVSAASIDFVTSPGAGGTILQLSESLRATQAVNQPAAESRTTKEHEMDDKELATLREAAAETGRLKTELARMKERDLVRDAKAFAVQALSASALPDVTKRRLAESLATNPVAKEDGTLDSAAFAAVVTEAVKVEAAYLAEVNGSGQVRNLGAASEAAAEADPKEIDKLIESGFASLGLSENAARIAAAGRRV